MEKPKGINFTGRISFIEEEGGYTAPQIEIETDEGIVDFAQALGKFVEKFKWESSRTYCFDETKTIKKYEITIREI